MSLRAVRSMCPAQKLGLASDSRHCRMQPRNFRSFCKRFERSRGDCKFAVWGIGAMRDLIDHVDKLRETTMKSLIKLFLLTAVAVIAMAGCATGPKITADYDQSTNFATYRSFGFYQPLGTDQAGYESLITQTLKAAVRQEMEARGYVYAETGAELLLNFNAKLAQQTRVTQTAAPMPVYYGYRRGFYGGWGGYAQETQVDQYVEGTLNIDMVDAARKQLVWEGVAVGRVGKKTADEREAAIRSAVSEIFAKYPFRAGS